MSGRSAYGVVALGQRIRSRWVLRLMSITALVALALLARPEHTHVHASHPGDIYLPLVCAAQNAAAPAIPADTLVQGRITTAGRPVNYTYAAEAPGWVSVRMFGDAALDPYLIFITPTGSALCTDDNAAGVGSAAFFSCHLPSAGPYTIAAAASDGTTGAYRLMLEKGQSAHLADINHDCEVETADASILSACWGSVATAGPCAKADLNLDGAVDGGDLGIVAYYWGRTCD